MVRTIALALVMSGLLTLALRPPEERELAPLPAAPAQTQATMLYAKHAPTRAQRRASRDLIIPVTGLSSADLVDTWGDARSEGRSHQGIDIMAPRGRAVVAAVDGRIVKFFDSDRGGTTIYQFDGRGRYVYYYAHLESRAVGLNEGDIVRQGDIIGYVGSTGNATTPHLHFEIQLLGPEQQWWRATSVNPYTYLVDGRTPA
jgi:murein DD-endopeptidase MepM/ murein hydrolase activator NlpD